MLVPDHNLAGQASTAGPPGSLGTSISWEDASKRAYHDAEKICGRNRRHLAEEIAQESLQRLSQRINHVRAGWKAYLSAIVVNVARSTLRREFCRRVPTDGDSSKVDELAGDEEDPSAGAVLSDELAETGKHLKELDARFGEGTQAIVELRAQDVPWEDIVKVTGIPLRTCSYRYKQATEWVCDRMMRHEQKGGGRE